MLQFIFLLLSFCMFWTIWLSGVSSCISRSRVLHAHIQQLDIMKIFSFTFFIN